MATLAVHHTSNSEVLELLSILVIDDLQVVAGGFL